MNSNFSNPFSRPSPFSSSNTSKDYSSPSPYSYENNRIIESQVKPGLSGMSSPFLNPTSTSSYTSNYMDRYNNNQRPNPFANPTSRPSLTSSPLPSYDPMFSGYNQYSNTSISQNQSYSQSYSQGPKQNPFNRPSLLGISHNNSYSLKEQLMIGQPTGRNYASDSKNGYLAPTSYEHLMYKPNSNSTQVQRNPVPIYSHQTYETTKYSPHKYNPNTYRTDNSDTTSVTSYINKVNDLVDDTPYRKNKELQENMGNKSIDMFEHKPLKDYSHLQYKANKSTQPQNLPHSNGLDKLKFIYEKQKSKSNEYELQNKHQINNEQEQLPKYPYQQISSNYPKQTQPHYNSSSSDHRIQGSSNNQKSGSLEKRNYQKKNSLEKHKYEKYEKKYEFQDFNENEEYQQSKHSQNYEKNIYKPVQKYEPDQKYEPESKYQPIQKYGRIQNYEQIPNHNRFEDFDEDKEFNFDNRQQFNEEDSVEPRFDNNFRNNSNQTQNYINPKQYASPQFGNSYIPESNQRQNDMIVRFGDDDSHYANDYSIRNQRQPESVPTNDSRLNRNSGNDRYPSVVSLKGIQFYKINLVNN